MLDWRPIATLPKGVTVLVWLTRKMRGSHIWPATKDPHNGIIEIGGQDQITILKDGQEILAWSHMPELK